MMCCIPRPRRIFLSTDVKDFSSEPEIVLMNCKFGVLLSETISGSEEIFLESVIGAVCRTFFVIVIFESTRECLQAGARGTSIFKLKIFSFGIGGTFS